MSLEFRKMENGKQEKPNPNKRFSELKVEINLHDYYAIPDPSKIKIYFQFAAA